MQSLLLKNSYEYLVHPSFNSSSCLQVHTVLILSGIHAFSGEQQFAFAFAFVGVSLAPVKFL